MSLRGPKHFEAEETGTKHMTFRVPQWARDYLRWVKATQGRDYTEITFSAWALDRDLAEYLKADVERLKAAAERRGLSMGEGLARVLADLVLLGLDADEKKKR
jgi:hypothetical protein